MSAVPYMLGLFTGHCSQTFYICHCMSRHCFTLCISGHTCRWILILSSLDPLPVPPLSRRQIHSGPQLPLQGPKDLKNDTGLVNFFKHFKGTPPSPSPKKEYVRP